MNMHARTYEQDTRAFKRFNAACKAARCRTREDEGGRGQMGGKREKGRGERGEIGGEALGGFKEGECLENEQHGSNRVLLWVL